MPTNFASKATAPRMRSASAAIVCSASGRATNRASIGFVEPALEDKLRRDRVARGTAVPPVDTVGGKLGVRGNGREALVDAVHRQPEAAGEFAGEALGACGHLVLATISVERAPHDEHVGPPFVDQRCDC